MSVADLPRALHGGGSARNGAAPRNSGGPTPGPANGQVRVLSRSTAVADQVQDMIQSALAWRNLVQMLWIESGRPPVPGFPASRVQQILWGELPPENGFFSALLGALTSRSRAGSAESWFRNALRAYDSDVPPDARHIKSLHVSHPAADHGADFLMLDAEGNMMMAVQVKDTRLGSSIGAASTIDAEAEEQASAATLELGKRLLARIRNNKQPNPDTIETEAEFMAALRQLKETTKLSLRQIEERSKTTTGWLPRSSAADMLRRETLPKPDALWSLTAALGLTKEDQDKWEAARSRLFRQHRTQRRLRPVLLEDGDPGPEEHQSLVNDDLDA